MFSVFSFVAQVETVPDEAFEAEAFALRRFAPGPGAWATKQDLFHLRELFGFPASFPSLQIFALASKLRCLAFEVRDADRHIREITEAWVSGEHALPPLPYSWYAASHAQVLIDARQEASRLGVTHGSIMQALAAQAPTGREDRDNYVRKHYQREAYNQLLRLGPLKLNAEARHRKKQHRWQLELAPRLRALRAVTLFKRLSPLVRPRVLASVARAHWNGWCTRRRFQQCGACVFQCTPSAADSIEHYAFCAVFGRLAESFLHLPKIATMQMFLLLDHRLWSDQRLIVTALAVHALYAAFNHCRLLGPHTREHILDYMERSCYNAVLNHPKSARALHLALSNSRNWWQ